MRTIICTTKINSTPFLPALNGGVSRSFSDEIPPTLIAFDQQEWNVKPCAKINITFINDDQIRHQIMVHGLPGYLYPDGMVHLELYGEGQLQASFIVPSRKKTYLVHCELPQLLYM